MNNNAGIDPETLLFVGLMGAIGTAATYILFRVAPTIGGKISARDLLPALPPSPPIPRFLIEKPEVIESTKEDIFGLKGGTIR